MTNMKKILISALFGLTLTVSCVNLDIPPKNTVTSADLLSNEAGMDIYMARMYSLMPFEDFKYQSKWGVNFNGWLNSSGIEGTGEAVGRDDIVRAFTGEDEPYWSRAFSLLREANFLIESLPAYRSAYPEVTYNHYLGEAYYVRATVFYAMARRFGGIPLVTRVIAYPDAADRLEVPRASERETWDRILADFDTAAELMQPRSIKSGYSNRYVALAFKSQAMLYAGCVAKYNQTVSGRLTGLGQKTGVRVMGFGDDEWEAASKKYFTESYKAAREVMADGGYSLYKKKWEAGNPEAQYQNMVDMFSDASSPENIYVHEYLYPTTTHGYDAYNVPYIFRAPLSSGTCPTLDFVELFDGFDRYPDGTIKVTDGNSNSQGNYLLFDSPMVFFKNAEPRLRAYVIFPDDIFRKTAIEIRAGVYTGSVPIKPLMDDYSYAGAEKKYQDLPAFKNKTLHLGSTPTENNSTNELKAAGFNEAPAGANGPFYSSAESAITGFIGRKWLNPDDKSEIGEGKSAQHYVLMRYGEVLLNAAEAAVELALAGEAAPDGADLLQVATDAVNEIRERAGAQLLAGRIQATDAGRNIVRKERRKELGFERSVKWDLRRWRVNHYDGRDGFWGETRDKNRFSNNSRFRFRGLYPFYSTEAKKYFFDAFFTTWVSNRTFEYNVIDYYFAIPGNEVVKSPVIDQQPNR